MNAADVKYPTKYTKIAIGCTAQYNCWLINGHDYCGVCKRGDYELWRKKCEAARKAQGVPSYAEALESAQKSFGAVSGQEAK